MSRRIHAYIPTCLCAFGGFQVRGLKRGLVNTLEIFFFFSGSNPPVTSQATENAYPNASLISRSFILTPGSLAITTVACRGWLFFSLCISECRFRIDSLQARPRQDMPVQSSRRPDIRTKRTSNMRLLSMFYMVETRKRSGIRAMLNPLYIR